MINKIEELSKLIKTNKEKVLELNKKSTSAKKEMQSLLHNFADTRVKITKSIQQKNSIYIGNVYKISHVEVNENNLVAYITDTDQYWNFDCLELLEETDTTPEGGKVLSFEYYKMKMAA